MKDEEKIWIQNRQKKIRLNLPRIRKSAALILKALGKERMALSLLFVNDRAIQKLNLQFRKMDLPTDVLSFPMSNNIPLHPPLPPSLLASGSAAKLCSSLGERIKVRGPEMRLLGDIVISVETAQKQAENLGHSLEREVTFLLIHGVLHLSGWNHERSPQDAKKMYKFQRELLGKIYGPV